MSEKVTLPYTETVEQVINESIKSLKPDTNLISDGYHTFGELYEHRIVLWIALCRLIAISPSCTGLFTVWKTKVHSDGSVWDGWFLLGINCEPGDQMTYHLPEKDWEKCWFADELPQAYEFDGHTPNDVINRINAII